MDHLPDLWDAEACAQWVHDECQKEVEKLLFGVPLSEIEGDIVELKFDGLRKG